MSAMQDDVCPTPIQNVEIDMNVMEVKKSKGGYDLDETNSIVWPAESENLTGATVLGSIMNLAKSVLGTGILALPYALGESGWAVGVGLLVFSLFTSVFTLHLVSASRHRLGPNVRASYGAIFESAFPGFGWIADLLIVLMCIGGMISYLIVLGALMPQFISEVSYHPPGSILFNRQFWIAVIGVCLSLPLSSLRDIGPLKYTSFMALGATLYIVLLSILFLAKPLPIFDPCGNGVVSGCQGIISPIQPQDSPLDVLKSFPVFIFSFTAHPLVPEIYNVIRKPTMPRMNTVCGWALLIAAFFYTVFSFCGYFTYGRGVNSNILLSYPVVMPVSIARILMCFSMAVSYPLLLNPTREACQGIISNIMIRYNRQRKIAPGTRGEIIMFWSVTAFLFIVSLGIALAVSNLGVVFSVVGATAATASAYIIPALTYLKMYVYYTPEDVKTRGWVEVSSSKYATVKKWLSFSSLAFGIVFIPLALIGIFMK